MSASGIGGTPPSCRPSWENTINLAKIKKITNNQCVNKSINDVNLEKVLQNITQVGRVVHIVPVEDRQLPHLMGCEYISAFPHNDLRIDRIDGCFSIVAPGVADHTIVGAVGDHHNHTIRHHKQCLLQLMVLWFEKKSPTNNWKSVASSKFNLNVVTIGSGIAASSTGRGISTSSSS